MIEKICRGERKVDVMNACKINMQESICEMDIFENYCHLESSFLMHGIMKKSPKTAYHYNMHDI
jgi:hypothetical protein